MKKTVQTQIHKTDPVEEEARQFKKEIEKRYERNQSKFYQLKRDFKDDSSDSSI